VEAAGFAALDRASLQQAGRMVVSVEGMWCGSCALAVERTIARTPGVTSASTSFAGGSALVCWDPARFDLDLLLKRVSKLGYRMVPLVEAQEMERQIESQARLVWMRLAVAGFFGMWSMLGSIVLYAEPGFAATRAGWWLALASCLLALPAVTWPAWDFYRAGWRTLRAGVPGMDALVSLGVLAASALSAWALVRGSPSVYPDTATMLVIFLSCGRLIELHARRRNSVAVNALRQAVPETARRIGDDGATSEVPVELALPGTRVEVLAGERIAVDGVVTDGESALDRALVSGESLPVPVRPGDRVEAGCINLDARLVVRVEVAYGDRFIDRIGVRMLELFGAKSAVALQAERFARWLAPVALVLAALGFGAAWLQGEGAAAAALRALSVLVAACPCAVGLALPLAYAGAAASAARHGILFRDPASLEALAGARAVLFDKTGTLTHGRLEVAATRPATGVEALQLLHWAAQAEAGIAHPVAQAITRAAAVQGWPAIDGNAQRHAQGSAWCSADGTEAVVVGNAAFMATQGVALPAGATAPEGSQVEVARNGAWIGSLLLRDQLRADAPGALAAFAGAGLDLRLVSGDCAAAALPVAAAVGLQPAHVHAACLPEDKVAVLAAARRPAVFVGDGVNDALALAAADCGVSVQGASTAAVATAGVVIASGGLAAVSLAWRHARRTVRVVRQNLVFSMVYNVCVLGFAASGTVPPVAAALAMLASSVSVVANSGRLSRFRQAPA
jgi:heavy metal translocating P-type ATPase